MPRNQVYLNFVCPKRCCWLHVGEDFYLYVLHSQAYTGSSTQDSQQCGRGVSGVAWSITNEPWMIVSTASIACNQENGEALRLFLACRILGSIHVYNFGNARHQQCSYARPNLQQVMKITCTSDL